MLTQPEKFEILCTRAEHLALVASSNFQNFPRKHQIKWSDLRDVPVAISGGCAVALEKLYGDIKQELNVVSISTSKQTALAWIETNRVAAIVPLEKGELMRSDLQIAYLQSNMSLEKSIVRVKNRSLSYVAEVFLDFYKELES